METNELKKSFLKENPNDTEKFHILMAQALNKSNAYLPSFQLIFSGLEENSISYKYEFLEALFPSPYQREIASNSKFDDLRLVYSLMRQESGFNPLARSPVGALGLMQLMPRTAQKFDKDVTKDTLRTPKPNVKIGTQYLQELAKRYKNDVINMLAAYNAGESRIDKWRKTYMKFPSELYNIEAIPFNETRKYVKLILRNMYFYKILKEKPKLIQALK